LGAIIKYLDGLRFNAEHVGWIQVAGAIAVFLCFVGLAAVTKALTAQVIHPWKHAASHSLNGLFFGGVVLLVAYVMEEGCRLKSEQELVI
jgi:hypothetical protein